MICFRHYIHVSKVFPCCRCRRWQPVSSAHRQLQWSVCSKLHQGTLWLVHISANTDAAAVSQQLSDSSSCSECFPRVSLKAVFPSDFLANPQLFSSSCLSAVYCRLTRGKERGRADREYCSVSQRLCDPLCSACWHEDPVPSQALPLSLWFSDSLKWHQALATARRVNRSHFAEVQDQFCSYFFGFYWIYPL